MYSCVVYIWEYVHVYSCCMIQEYKHMCCYFIIWNFGDVLEWLNTYDSFHWKWTPPQIRKIIQLKIPGTNPNWTKKISWVCTARYQGIWVSGFGGYQGGVIFSGNCHIHIISYSYWIYIQYVYTYSYIFISYHIHIEDIFNMYSFILYYIHIE